MDNLVDLEDSNEKLVRRIDKDSLELVLYVESEC